MRKFIDIVSTNWNAFFWFGINLALFSALLVPFLWWQELRFLPALTSKKLCIIGLLIAGSSALYGLRTKTKFWSTQAATGAAAILLLLFFSGWMDTDYSYFHGPLIRGELLVAVAIALVIPIRYFKHLLCAVLLLTMLSMGVNYLTLAQGRLLFSDDHPPFLHRLMQLTENALNLPIYDVMWNAGVDSMYLFASGVIGVFLLFSPFLYLFTPEAVYTYLPLLIAVLVVPGAMYWAAKELKFDSSVALTASILAIGNSLFWYRWLLKYGTLGFCLSAALFPLVLALICKHLKQDSDLNNRQMLVLLICVSLCLSWPLMGLALVPAAFVGLFCLKTILKKPRLLLTTLLCLLVNLPWMWLFLKDYAIPKNLKPSITVEQTKEPQVETVDLEKNSHLRKPKPIGVDATLAILQKERASSNPILLFFSLPGLFLLFPRSRLLWGLTMGWTGLLGAVLYPHYPMLELNRFLHLLLLIGAIPSGALICSAWSKYVSSPTFRNRLAPAILSAFLIAGIRPAAEIMGSKRIERFSFAGKRLGAIASQIKNHTGSGRVLFSGFVLHDLEKGHLAPLTHFAETPMIASSPVHNLWYYKQVFPKWALDQSDAGINSYLDLMNVSNVVAHERIWKRYFLDRKESFEHIWTLGPWMFFKRKSGSLGYFLEGEGEILEQSSSGVKLRIDSKDAVIKFNYYPSVESSSCELSSKLVAPDTEFIELQNCTPGETVQIQSKSFWNRVLY